ncbi:MAG TPA: restriction endonuclease subunit S [Deltaproteobacteria bacterium]|nr:MAG: hypothetical protein AUK23_01185 [Deltaproteobacteria bacterium CG2_30_43_15]PIZ19214.1 MAG: restriction endonuclease subunit S [Deltaproteobacteria bacterium CG_4_10_14_0_8_um_filter_43_12]HCX89088.1 restriction endonuclease subunit S [Deltaproteobacteria bacterium]
MGSEWGKLAFIDAVEINPSITLKKGHRYPFVDMKAVDPSWRNVSESEYRDFSSGGARFKPYDTLMARITPCLENEKIARYVPTEGNEGPAFGSTEFIVIRGRDGVTDNNFAYYLTQWQEFRQFAISQMTGSSGRQRVPAESFSNFSVPVPTLPEQRAIAHILGTLDDKIELNRKMNETLEAMARALFKNWFVDFLPVRAKAESHDTGLPKEIADLFPDAFVDSELGDIPKGWHTNTLGNILELAYGKALKEAIRRPGSIPVFGSNGQVGWHDEKLTEGPGIVVGRKGNPGIITWVHTDFFPIDTTFYVVPKSECRSLYFLFYALQAQDVASLGADSSVLGLNRNLAYMNKQVIPPPDVLNAFDKQVKPLFERIFQNTEESRILAALRDTLLPKLISGALRVPDAERFIEEAGG